ncbi:MAG: hypothetical protein NC399_03005 [Muribaculum sp.]|nr:hypothetical protein [Muribaculum sp.]
MTRYPKDQSEDRRRESYLDNGARAKENRSSAWALLIVGGVGFVGVLLGMTGVLPLRLSNPYLFYGVMMAVFLLFVVMGALSMKNARIFAEKAEVENTLLETVEKWCLEAFRAEKLPPELSGEITHDHIVESCEADNAETGGADSAETAEEDGQEMLYFRRVEYLREQINRQFLNLDQGLLERFIDERLYERIFGE